MSLPTPAARGKTIALVIGVVLALVAGLFVAYQFSRIERKDIGNGIVVEGSDLPDGLVSSIADPETSLPDDLKQFQLAGTGQVWAKRISKVYDIGPSGPLKSPIRAEIPVDELPADGGPHVLTAFSGEAGDPNSMEVVPIVDQGVRPDGQAYVTVKLQHLSLKSIFESFTEVIGGAVVKFFEFAGADVTKEAEAPVCRNEVSSKEYLVRIDGSPDALLSCLDRDRTTNKLKLHVVNNRRYALKLDAAGMQPDGVGALKFDLAELYKLMNTPPMLRPREEAAFVLDDLKAGEKATLTSSVDGTSLFLTTLQSVAEVVLVAMGKNVDVDSTVAMMEAMFDLPGCGSAALDNLPDALPQMMRKCLTDGVAEAFEQKYTAKTGKSAGGKASGVAKLLSYVGAVMDVSDLTRSWSNFVGDATNGRAKQSLVVGKLNAPAKGTLTGLWERHGGSVTFGNGSAVIRIFQGNGGCGDPGQSCSLFLQLALSGGAGQSNGVVKDVWYGYGIAPEPHIQGLPGTMFEDTMSVGDTFTLRVDEHGVLKTTPHGAFYADGDLDGDGQLDDAFQYCNAQTQDAFRSPCGA